MTMEKEDPIRLHKEGTTLYEVGKYDEAAEKLLQASVLYEKRNNFFDASNMIFRAGECSFMTKDYKTAIERFNKSADIAFSKGFDRFGVSALEYILDCHKALKKEKSKEAIELEKRIKEVKEKLAAQPF
jgi:tetratricopeptide (TPR) repeat protein